MSLFRNDSVQFTVSLICASHLAIFCQTSAQANSGQKGLQKGLQKALGDAGRNRQRNAEMNRQRKAPHVRAVEAVDPKNKNIGKNAQGEIHEYRDLEKYNASHELHRQAQLKRDQAAGEEEGFRAKAQHAMDPGHQNSFHEKAAQFAKKADAAQARKVAQEREMAEHVRKMEKHGPIRAVSAVKETPASSGTAPEQPQVANPSIPAPAPAPMPTAKLTIRRPAPPSSSSQQKLMPTPFEGSRVELSPTGAVIGTPDGTPLAVPPVPPVNGVPAAPSEAPGPKQLRSVIGVPVEPGKKVKTYGKVKAFEAGVGADYRVVDSPQSHQDAADSRVLSEEERQAKGLSVYPRNDRDIRVQNAVNNSPTISNPNSPTIADRPPVYRQDGTKNAYGRYNYGPHPATEDHRQIIEMDPNGHSGVEVVPDGRDTKAANIGAQADLLKQAGEAAAAKARTRAADAAQAAQAP